MAQALSPERGGSASIPSRSEVLLFLLAAGAMGEVLVHLFFFAVFNCFGGENCSFKLIGHRCSSTFLDIGHALSRLVVGIS